MEDKFKQLLSTSDPKNRSRWAQEWQKRGKKVIGVLDSLVPEEVIYAAGMLPWRIQGSWREDVTRAMTYRHPQGNTFLNHVLESLLAGELDFLDGMVCSNRDEDFRRFRDYWEWLNKKGLAYIIEVPTMDTEKTRQRFTAKIRDFIGAMEDTGRVKIDNNTLRQSIAVYDRGYSLLRKLYELRKKEVPPLSGSEALALTTAAMVMPRGEFNNELEELMPYLVQRKASVSHPRPRLLLSSDMLDNPAYIELVEETGCLVAMDDLDNGSRYFWRTTDGNSPDPASDLARRYLQNGSPRMFDWRGQIERLVSWVREFNIDGVLELVDMFDYPRAFRRPYLEKWLKEEGIPVMSFDRDYCLTNLSQLKTRIGAFLEIVQAKTGG
jgi:benzoyl-CoA reductase subunit C